jgi:hypothetical protein
MGAKAVRFFFNSLMKDNKPMSEKEVAKYNANTRKGHPFSFFANEKDVDTLMVNAIMCDKCAQKKLDDFIDLAIFSFNGKMLLPVNGVYELVFPTEGERNKAVVTAKEYLPTVWLERR